MRAADPDHLEELARRLDGDGGVLGELNSCFTRASTLGVRSELTRLNPLQSWVEETGPDLRRRAGILAAEGGDPNAGLLWAGFTREEMAGVAFDPELALLANTAAISGGEGWEWMQRQDGESLNNWRDRVLGDAAGRIADDEALGDSVTSYLELLGDIAGGTRAVSQSGGAIVSLARSGGYPNAPGTFIARQWAGLASGGGRFSGVLSNLSGRFPAMRTALTNFGSRVTPFVGGSDDLARAFGMYVNRAGTLMAPQFAAHTNLWTVGAASTRASGSLVTGLGTAARTGGWLRGAGIVGSAAATIWSAANVVSWGNPVDAFQRDAAGYSSDVAGTLFNGALTVAMVAPTPLTLGIAAGAGLIYAGTLVWKNWGDDIAEAWGATTEWVGDAVDTIADVGGDIVSGVSDFVGGLF